MRIQVLLSMGQDRLSKEEATELLDQRVHVIASTQELRHQRETLSDLQEITWEKRALYPS